MLDLKMVIVRLKVASINCKKSVVGALIKAGADVNGENVMRHTRSVDAIKMLIEVGANIDTEHKWCDETQIRLLKEAHFGGSLEIIKFLI